MRADRLRDFEFPRIHATVATPVRRGPRRDRSCWLTVAAAVGCGATPGFGVSHVAAPDLFARSSVAERWRKRHLPGLRVERRPLQRLAIGYPGIARRTAPAPRSATAGVRSDARHAEHLVDPERHYGRPVSHRTAARPRRAWRGLRCGGHRTWPAGRPQRDPGP